MNTLRIILTINAKEVSAKSDMPAEIIVQDDRMPEEPKKLLLRTTIDHAAIEHEFSKLCPACRHFVTLCNCQREGKG